MILNKKIIFLLAIIYPVSCKSQEVKIFVRDLQSAYVVTPKVYLLTNGNDTILLKDVKPGVYEIKEPKNSLILEYKENKYLLKDLENVKSILIDYDQSAEKGCVFITKIAGDVGQFYYSDSIFDLKCIRFTYIYMFNVYNPDISNLPKIINRKVSD